jgi:hypothetical protein
MEFSFTGELIEWRGPAPFYFIQTPIELTAEIKAIAAHKTYGWGMLYVNVSINKSKWKTTLTPKDGAYLIPIKNAIRLPAKFELGQRIDVKLSFDI